MSVMSMNALSCPVLLGVNVMVIVQLAFGARLDSKRNLKRTLSPAYTEPSKSRITIPREFPTTASG